MSEFKGTPGPWIVDEDFDVTTNDGCVVAWTAVGVFEHEENLSNAQLIAAAPDLLAAIQDLLHADCHSVRNSTVHNQAMHKAIAAISKATGE